MFLKAEAILGAGTNGVWLYHNYHSLISLTLCQITLLYYSILSNIIKCLWELVLIVTIWTLSERIPFFWKYQQLRYLNCILIYTLNSSIIYVNKNKFIIVYNSLFCFASTSTHDENAQIHRKIFRQIWSQIWSKNLREPVVLTGRMKLTSIYTLNVSYNQLTVWNNWVETKIENRIK